MDNNNIIIPDWSYVLDENKVVSQCFSRELHNETSCVSTLEYLFDNNSFSLPKKEVNGKLFSRLGIKYSTKDLKNINLKDYVYYNKKLGRELSTIYYKNINKIITPEEQLLKILNDKLYVNDFVKRDLIHYLKVLKKFFSENFVNEIGVEGSLAFEISTKNSDIDLLINGKDNFWNLYECWSDIIDSDKKLIKLSESDCAQKQMCNNRKIYIPYSEKDIIFHETRKMFSYIMTDEIIRKINIVGKLSEKERAYKERYREYFENYSFVPIEICTIEGVVDNDNYGYYIPSIYDIKANKIKSKNNVDPKQIKYIIDYIGNYYMHIFNGEMFQCCGMLEQIYKNDIALDVYRISLNPWDNVYDKKMFLKTIERGGKLHERIR
ncbi:MAG: nucleotidyltransferase domain-containing protein [Bacilli bacterium]